MAIIYCGPEPSSTNAGDNNTDIVTPSMTTAVIASDTAPSQTNVLWVDTAHTNLLKYYDSTSGTWIPTSAAWG